MHEEIISASNLIWDAIGGAIAGALLMQKALFSCNITHQTVLYTVLTTHYVDIQVFNADIVSSLLPGCSARPLLIVVRELLPVRLTCTVLPMFIRHLKSASSFAIAGCILAQQAG